MIYISGVPSRVVGSTRAFEARGLKDATIGQVGSTGIFAIPNEKQLAYDVYTSNLEAFLYATAIKTKVICSNQTFPFPADYQIKVPLPIPATLVRFRTAPPQAVMTKILEKRRAC